MQLFHSSQCTLVHYVVCMQSFEACTDTHIALKGSEVVVDQAGLVLGDSFLISISNGPLNTTAELLHYCSAVCHCTEVEFTISAKCPYLLALNVFVTIGINSVQMTSSAYFSAC